MAPPARRRPPPELGPPGVTEAVAARYREILPPVFTVETRGPLLGLHHPAGGGGFFGNFVLHIPFLPAKVRLEEFAKIAFKNLPSTVERAAQFVPEAAGWPGIGTEWYVRITDDDVHVWFGHSDIEEEAVITVRPIPRSDLGL